MGGKEVGCGDFRRQILEIWMYCAVVASPLYFAIWCLLPKHLVTSTYPAAFDTIRVSSFVLVTILLDQPLTTMGA